MIVIYEVCAMWQTGVHPDRRDYRAPVGIVGRIDKRHNPVYRYGLCEMFGRWELVLIQTTHTRWYAGGFTGKSCHLE
jgi:hypothetical protein